MCGTISPTKTIGPQAAVAAPHSRVTATIAAARVQRGAGAEGAGRVVAERQRVQRPGERQREERARER